MGNTPLLRGGFSHKDLFFLTKKEFNKKKEMKKFRRGKPNKRRSFKSRGNRSGKFHKRNSPKRINQVSLSRGGIRL